MLTRCMLVVVPAAFTANVPFIMRSRGIEAVKGMLIDSVALPTILLFVAASFGQSRISRRRTVLFGGNAMRPVLHGPSVPQED